MPLSLFRSGVITLITVLYACTYTSALATSKPSVQPAVAIGKTAVVGKQITQANSSIVVDFFGGIPYAQPPLGNLRLNLPVFKPALDVERFDASDFGPGCLQTPPPPSGVSEDCLTLTIFRPSGVSSQEKLPVMAWIYGGGFTVGATSFYDATNLVTRSVERGTPVIFVSINYRLGPLGFPTGNEVGALLRNNTNILNLGLHDQLVGLEWVQQNIGQFGGDNTKVTIMGESAGSTSIGIHLSGSRIQGLVHAAILESPPLIPTFDSEKREGVWNSWVNAIPGCASSGGNAIECIRRSDSAALLQALINDQVVFQANDFQPTLDGPNGLVPDRPSQLSANKLHLPVMMGSNLDEGTIVIDQRTNSTEEIRNFILNFISPSLVSPEEVNRTIDTILDLYPDIPALGSPFGTGNNTFGLSSQYKRLSAIFGDLIVISSRRTLTHRMSQAGDKVFGYLFTDPEAVVFPEFAPPAVPGSLGVPHSSEIPYVFGNFVSGVNGSGPSLAARGLSVSIQDYWISFAASHNPNDEHGQKRPDWQAYTPDKQVVMQLTGDSSFLVPDTFRLQQLAFWEDHPDFLVR
ncbi:hypothetical protein CVT25_000045 [Psilocybe cyanescens]|uniref:Carboxylic ester hydrolase n=1 Tax=Psilocybe cyanescens TaxID=93625 RepID=A0A409X8J0_PSICY|nr:hypothetical protein CVT25_000045 [Psilocybe cyanescens]